MYISTSGEICSSNCNIDDKNTYFNQVFFLPIYLRNPEFMQTMVWLQQTPYTPCKLLHW